MDNPLVSVVIPTHNRKDMVVRLLKSVLGSTYKNIEIIVVDDASTDGTSKYIRKIFSAIKNIILVRNPINLHTAGSRNEGTKRSKGKYIFYIDDDNVLDKYAISKLVHVFEDDSEIGELGLVNYYFNDKKKIFWVVTKRDMTTSRTHLPNSLDSYKQKKIWDTDDVPNAYMMRTEPIKKYGITFCDKFGIMYEDCDVSFRLKKFGYTIKVVREAVIYHDVGDYMDHFMGDTRLPFTFARNRLIFHSLYSTNVQLVSICLLWMWIFTAYYLYKIMSYSGSVRHDIAYKIKCAWAYIRGDIAGLLFIFRGEQLVYPSLG